MKNSGIYKIVSNLDGKEYIGSAVNLYQRWHHHKHHLDKGAHANSKLQRYANKYGLESLDFSVIETCVKERLIEREQHHIDERRPFFNICKKAGSSLGYRHSTEMRAYFSKIRKSQVNNGMRGRKHKESTKALISEKRKARGLHPNFKAASIAANTGRKHAPEEIKKRAVSQSKITPDQAFEIHRRLSIGHRQVDLAAEFGVCQRTISRIKQGLGLYGDEDYYKAACKRFDQETRQQAMEI